jgi:hypothetical protein
MERLTAPATEALWPQAPRWASQCMRRGTRRPRFPGHARSAPLVERLLHPARAVPVEV